MLYRYPKSKKHPYEIPIKMDISGILFTIYSVIAGGVFNEYL